jgi:uncharacterized surface protein with fasciclin (FAS1) repeats
MKPLNLVAAVLVVVGALNWGLVAIARFDLVAAIFGMRFGEVSALSAVVYGLVGLAAAYQLLSWKQWSKTLAVALLAVGLVSGAARVHAADNKDIVDTAVAAGSFTTLAKALDAAGLVQTLKGPGPFTVFAPTDAAFAKLPAGTLDNLLKPENKAQLQRILSYHVVGGRVMAADVVKMNSAKAVSGDTITIAAANGSVKVDNATVTKTDIAASNGVIHVIDSVILPKDK